MPGLAGFTDAGARPEESQRVLKRMRELLSHGESRRADELFGDGRVCATRSHTGIFQPQPQPFEKGGVWVWFDGEFYNREELEAMLDVSARRGTQPTDPSLLIALYAREGGGDFDFLRRVDGVYSAVVYDSNAGLLHLIADRCGLRHLFWTERGGGLAWASEAKAMLALPGFTPVVDRASVEDFIFGAGHMTGDRTWLEGVELLSAGTVLTWDLRRGALIGRRRYWSLDDIKPLGEVADEHELAAELGRRLRRSVERRAAQGDAHVGITLSGGLDSRAVLAATPEGARPLQAITFGREGCDDIRIAASAAAVKGAEHHLVKLDVAGWLAPRIEGVWRSDGQFNLMHMQVLSVAPLARQLFEVNLDGFLGDATIGGSYIDTHGADERWNFENRGRRFISQGPSVLRPFVESRLPFVANEFLELALAAPARLRKDSRLYHMMLLLTFPEFFEGIPWQKTGLPVAWPATEVKRRSRLGEKKDRLVELATYFGLYRHPTRSYADYPGWIRREPARSFFESTLRARGALYAEFVPRERVESVLASHMAGRERSEQLGRFLTFEVWLRQVFEGEYRTAHEALPLMVEAG